MRKAKRAGDWPWERTETSEPVAVEDITRDAGLQVRSSIDQALARKYAHEMQAGAAFPPVELAAVSGRLLLLDGWHRLEAAHLINGHGTIEAVVKEMALEEATWQAAKANMKHGKPYTAKEKRAVLRAYIKGKNHRDGKNLKSYRDIGRELFIKLGTLYRWMEADHPKVAKAMSADRAGNDRADSPPMDPEPELLRRLEQALRDAGGLYEELLSPRVRGRAIFEAETMLEKMKQKAFEKYPW